MVVVTPRLKVGLVDWSNLNPVTLVSLSVQLTLIWLVEAPAAITLVGACRSRGDIGEPDVVHGGLHRHAMIDNHDIQRLARVRRRTGPGRRQVLERARRNLPAGTGRKRRCDRGAVTLVIRRMLSPGMGRVGGARRVVVAVLITRRVIRPGPQGQVEFHVWEPHAGALTSGLPKATVTWYVSPAWATVAAIIGG